MGKIDVDRLLRAIARKESRSGENNCPRFEASYIPKGLSFTVQGRLLVGTGRNVNGVVQPRWLKWGLQSAASFSSWQILYHTAADLGFDGPPHTLWDDSIALPWVRRRLAVIATRVPEQTVERYADAWNSGSARDANVPAEYIADLVRFYKEA